jgi:uncharacterized protein
MHKILITGGSGMIGTRLTQMLKTKGYSVAHLGRSTGKTGLPSFIWDIKSRKIEPKAFEGVDTIVHLAGANVGEKRWTRRRKQEILESRTHSTRLLFEFLKSNTHQVKNFISASAIGYYGFDDSEKMHREDDPPGDDFLAEVVKKWEAEVDEIKVLGLRVVKVRVGIVLSRDEGALKEMVKPIRFYVGAPLGTGNQKLSWIHIDDLCQVFVKAIEDESLNGAVNAVGTKPVSNRELTEAIARSLNKPLILPSIPPFALKLLLGEMGELALKGSSVSNEKLVEKGFQYNFPTLDEALRDLLK